MRIFQTKITIYFCLIRILFSFEVKGQIANFENLTHLDTNYFTMDTSGIWEIGKPNKPTFFIAYSVPNAIVTDTINSYPINANSSFIIQQAGCLHVEAYIQCDTDYGKDGLIIEMYCPDSNAWLNLIRPGSTCFCNDSLKAFLNSLTLDSSTLYNGQLGYSGYNIFYFTTDIVTWDGSTLKIKIRFRFISDSILDTLDGVMIDDIQFYQTTCPGGIHENSFNSFKIFPNPVSSIINIESNFSIKNQIKITNQLGEIVQQVFLKNNAIDVSKLVVGLYFVTIESERGAFTQKFVKQ